MWKVIEVQKITQKNNFQWKKKKKISNFFFYFLCHQTQQNPSIPFNPSLYSSIKEKRKKKKNEKWKMKNKRKKGEKMKKK